MSASRGHLKLRAPRRRMKIAVICTILLGMTLFLIFHQNHQLIAQIGNKNGSGIVNPDEEVILNKFISMLRSLFTTKQLTIPYSETEAGVNTKKLHNSGSVRVFGTGMKNKDKLELIEELYHYYDPSSDMLKKGHNFYDGIFDVFYKGKPEMEKLDRYPNANRIYHARFDTTNKEDPVFSEKYLSQFLQLTPEELESMTKSHQYVMKNLPEHAPKNFYSGNGVVYVGGGKFNWLTLLSIKSMRAVGSEIPIEVLIPDLDEYEPDLCERIFPALNARCLFLPKLLSDGSTASSVSKFKFKGYQYKALAILLLSFENVLLLDSDNIAVRPPDNLFDEEPFKTHGLVVWPDFWRRATSPDYYKIAGKEMDSESYSNLYNELDGSYSQPSEKILKPLDEVPLHDRKGTIPDPTSESGQLMISKKTHTKALLLALYYNLYGPTHFYPLFSQGSDGEGDKETFLAATCAVGEKFYQVSKFLMAFGYFGEHGFEGTGMGQYDPSDDYLWNAKRKQDSKKDSKAHKNIEYPTTLKDGPRILFVHSNFPKLNPWELKSQNKIFNENGERIRLYGTGMKLRTGYDFEFVQWSSMKYLLCQLNIHLDIFKDIDRKELCEEVNAHLDFLEETSSALES